MMGKARKSLEAVVLAIGAILVVFVALWLLGGCTLHVHLHMGGQSKEPPITISIPERDTDGTDPST
jgi:hypothetical protein